MLRKIKIIYFIKKQLNLLCFVALCVVIFAMPVFAVEDGSIDGLWNPLLPLQNQPKKEPEKIISEIIIEGNNLIPTSEIMNSIYIREGDYFTKDVAQNALKGIYATGYFSPNLKAIPQKLPDDTISLRIIVEENIPISDFTIEGNEVVSTEDLMATLEPLLGSPQNIQDINQAIADLEDVYASRGYILARVVNLNDDPDGTINIEIKEGEINSINFEGNTKTKDIIVARNILTKPGEIYNENLIKQDLMRLYGTQAFKNVTRTIERNMDDLDKYDVTINLEEQRTGTLSIGGGIDTVTGLFGTAGFADNNFRGTGQRVSINGMVGSGVVNTDSSILNRANYQAEITWFEPRLRNSDNSLNIRLFGRDFASYQVPLAIERRLGLEAAIARQFKSVPNLIGSFGIGVEGIKVKEGDESEINRLFAAHNIPLSERAKQLDDGFFLTLSPTLTYDTRDNPLNPRRGFYGNLRLDEAIGIEDFGNTYGKITASGKKYFPIGKKSSFSLTGRAGGKFHGDMPEVMAYRLGGPYTVRGFQMSGVGTGEGFMMASGELRVPVPFVDRIKDGQIKFLNDLRIAFFVDAGKIFDESVTDKIYNRPGSAITTGLGLRVFIPGIGPLSVDWGYPLTGTDESGWSKGRFTFGVGEFY